MTTTKHFYITIYLQLKTKKIISLGTKSQLLLQVILSIIHQIPKSHLKFCCVMNYKNTSRMLLMHQPQFNITKLCKISWTILKISSSPAMNEVCEEQQKASYLTSDNQQHFVVSFFVPSTVSSVLIVVFESAEIQIMGCLQIKKVFLPHNQLRF